MSHGLCPVESVPETHGPIITSLLFAYPSFKGPPEHGLYIIHLCLLGLALGLARGARADHLCL